MDANNDAHDAGETFDNKCGWRDSKVEVRERVPVD
jgi:hypothetical protein